MRNITQSTHHILLQILSCRGAITRAIESIRRILGPKYTGEYLRHVIRERLGCLKLHQALTNVVIPTFDIKQLQPTIFSSYKVLPCMKLFNYLHIDFII